MAAGLHLAAASPEVTAPATPALALAVLCAAAAARPGSGRPAAALLLAAAAAWLAGVGLGVREGARAAGSCTAGLRSGQGVVVEGRASTAVRAGKREGRGPGARWARFELADARLRDGGRDCRVPRLLVRVVRPEVGIAAGSRVRVVGDWRRFGSADRRGPRPPGRYGAIYGTLAPRVPGGDSLTVRPDFGSGPRERLRALRARAGERLERWVPPDALPAAKALVLADRTDLAPEVTRSFADAGMIHLLAISGLHVGLLAGGVLWLAGFAGRRRLRWAVAALATGLYVAAIGSPPPATRAALLLAGLAAARARGSPARTGDLLGWAAGLPLLASPLLLVDPGYQLSFAGFAGLLAGDRAACRVLGLDGRRTRAGSRPPPRSAAGRALRRLRGPARALGASAGAFLATAPIAAAHFGRVAAASILSSLLGAPLVGLALAGLVPALVLPEPTGLPPLLAAGAAVPIRGLLGLAEKFAALPLHGSAAPPDPVGWAALAASAVGAALLLVGPGRSTASPAARAARARGLLCLAGAAALWTAGPGLRAVAGAGDALLCSLDVGQGDAAVLRTRGGRWVVFDAGPGPGFRRFGPAAAERAPESGPPASSWDAGTRTLVPFLRARGARAVDLFVLSHPHLDHLGGAAALFEAFRVRRVLDPAVPFPSGAYLRYLGAVEEEGARWLVARPGARLRLDGAEILVLAPVSPGVAGARVGDPNEASVALRVRIGGFVYLNTGDASVEAEERILSAWPADSLRADLLKLGHHGSRTSTSGAWLAATRPAVALVSVGGRNRYGHPHPSVLARLDSAGVWLVWRTDADGTLCVRVDEKGNWRVVPA